MTVTGRWSAAKCQRIQEKLESTVAGQTTDTEHLLDVLIAAWEEMHREAATTRGAVKTIERLTFFAEALRVERQAEADGMQAQLVAEAAGKREIAAALNTYSPEAARLQTLPDVLASVVKATEAAAMPLAEIERLSIIGGPSDTQDAVGGLLGVSPLAVAKIVESLRASGIDLAQLLNRSEPAAPTADEQPVSPTE